MQISLVSYQPSALQLPLLRKLHIWVSGSKDRSWLSPWVHKAGPEGGFVGSVFCVISWVSTRHRSCSIPSRCRLQSVIVRGNILAVKTSGCHKLLIVVQVLAIQHISALLGDSLLQVWVGLERGHIALVLGNYHVLSLDGGALIGKN